jgi:hypothetical protein
MYEQARCSERIRTYLQFIDRQEVTDTSNGTSEQRADVVVKEPVVHLPNKISVSCN